MSKRPLIVWLIIAVLIFNIYGTVSGLLQVVSGQGTYATSTLVISSASSVLAILLVPFIWFRLRKTKLLSWMMFGVLAINQVIAFARYSPRPDSEISGPQQLLLIGVFTLAMITIYALPSLYLQYSRYLQRTAT